MPPLGTGLIGSFADDSVIYRLVQYSGPAGEILLGLFWLVGLLSLLDVTVNYIFPEQYQLVITKRYRYMLKLLAGGLYAILAFVTLGAEVNNDWTVLVYYLGLCIGYCLVGFSSVRRKEVTEYDRLYV